MTKSKGFVSNLGVLNASMIDNNISQKKRLDKLNQTAIKQLKILSNDTNIIGIQNIDKNNQLVGEK